MPHCICFCICYLKRRINDVREQSDSSGCFFICMLQSADTCKKRNVIHRKLQPAAEKLQPAVSGIAVVKGTCYNICNDRKGGDL